MTNTTPCTILCDIECDGCGLFYDRDEYFVYGGDEVYEVRLCPNCQGRKSERKGFPEPVELDATTGSQLWPPWYVKGAGRSPSSRYKRRKARR